MKEIENEIEILNLEFEKIIDEKNSSKAIKDGAVNLKEYLESKYKIAWILKEVNSEDDKGGWDLREALKELKTETGIKNGWANTFSSIVYATYGIFNKVLWNYIPNYWEKPEIVDILNKIVYLNIKKTAGVSVAKHKELIYSYNKNKDIFLKQLEIYNPNIIICGNTFQYIEADLNLEGYKIKKFEGSNLCAYLGKNKIYIDAYHPSARINKESYVNDIINAVLIWIKNDK